MDVNGFDMLEWYLPITVETAVDEALRPRLAFLTVLLRIIMGGHQYRSIRGTTYLDEVGTPFLILNLARSVLGELRPYSLGTLEDRR